MLNRTNFRAIVLGERRDAAAHAWRALLAVLEVPYSLAVRFRNRQYDRNPRRTTRMSVPVVSVGNLTLGGTGKTPLVEWIARWLRTEGVRVTIVSRGYGATEGARNDEALELEQKLPDVPHLQNPDRVEGAKTAIEELACQVVLLDDGFQHRRLGRDLDIVVLDALDPWGGGRVFPRGMLREPISGLRRAQAVVLSRADLIDADSRKALRERVRQIAPQAVWAEAAQRPKYLLVASGAQEPLEKYAGRTALAFCGIGNPAGFAKTVALCGYRNAELREFPDHHSYSRADVDGLGSWARAHSASVLLCTHKDLVKLAAENLGGAALRAVVVGVEFLVGEAALTELLRRLLERVPPDPSDL